MTLRVIEGGFKPNTISSIEHTFESGRAAMHVYRMLIERGYSLLLEVKVDNERVFVRRNDDIPPHRQEAARMQMWVLSEALPFWDEAREWH